MVLDTLRRVSAYVRGNEDEFVRRVREASVVKRNEEAKTYRKRIAKNEKRIAELDLLFRKTYEDNAIGKLSDERFAQLSGAYEREQTELKQQNAALQAEVDSFDANSVKTDRFIELIAKYTDFTELTAPMINELVDRILVHEADKSSGKCVQRVDIYLSFIGNFDVPVPEPTAEELEAERKLDELRAKRREYNRRYHAKKSGKPVVPRLGDSQTVELQHPREQEEQTKTA